MRTILIFLTAICLASGCKTKALDVGNKGSTATTEATFTITFGSCNKSSLDNLFWDDISSLGPDVFIWGGDIVYADTNDVATIQAFYDDQDAVPEYAELKKSTLITGTWDDHDYGINDGGVEFESKKGSQQAFLNFLDIPENDLRRQRNGVYSTQVISKPQGSVKIINLDTRYHRTGLVEDKTEGRRYRPTAYGQGTILGERQWKWLADELSNSTSDFNLIVSSIQFLSREHGFEKWANHPHEVDKMKKIIVDSKAKGVLILSGDRHISEFSKVELEGLDYPLVDFTSSGLTHAYTNFSGEPNEFRVGNVVSSNSYGLIELDLDTKMATLKMMADNGKVLQELKQAY